MVAKYTSPSAYNFRFIAIHIAGIKNALLKMSSMALMKEEIAVIVFEMSVQSHPV